MAYISASAFFFFFFYRSPKFSPPISLAVEIFAPFTPVLVQLFRLHPQHLICSPGRRLGTSPGRCPPPHALSRTGTWRRQQLSAPPSPPGRPRSPPLTRPNIWGISGTFRLGGVRRPLPGARTPGRPVISSPPLLISSATSPPPH